ncbi:MAG: hypothetical protein CFH01_00553, partial [Alphaproteobacteria bacterium MarineAlpha2_Bin1]
NEILKSGFILHEYDLSRRGQNIFFEFKNFIQILRIIINVKPSILHLMTIKPIIYGGLFSIFFSKTIKVFSITGLGQVFTEKTIYARIRRYMILKIFKYIFKSKKSYVIVQNSYDLNQILERNLIERDRLFLIKGSGVNLHEFPFTEESDIEIPRVILASRLLWEKGVKQFVDAARILKDKEINVSFILVGDTHASNPRSVPKKIIEKWVKNGLIEWWGRKENMSEIISECKIVCLPTVYGEGVPKILLESAAMGRPLVVSDHPGCKEVVTDRVSGLIAEGGKPEEIVRCIKELLGDHEFRKSLILDAYNKIVKEFSSEIIIEQTIKIYEND